LGSLGGGNHFIEIAKDERNNKYLLIHSGSRNFGHKIATYFQKLAESKCSAKVEKDLRYLEGSDALEYLKCMRIAQKFAEVNRATIKNKILKYLGIKAEAEFESIHNYISNDNIIRKGAVDASGGKLLVIPINMRDGSILAKGLGNPEYNYSALTERVG
jgi:RNA-splicing ligase RtcB